MYKSTYIIAINATSGGGKTTTTKELQKQLPNANALYFEDRDYDNTTAHNIFNDMKQYLSQGRNAYLHGMNQGKEDVDFIVDGSKSFNEVLESIRNKTLDRNTTK